MGTNPLLSALPGKGVKSSDCKLPLADCIVDELHRSTKLFYTVYWYTVNGIMRIDVRNLPSRLLQSARRWTLIFLHLQLISCPLFLVTVTASILLPIYQRDVHSDSRTLPGRAALVSEKNERESYMYVLMTGDMYTRAFMVAVRIRAK